MWSRWIFLATATGFWGTVAAKGFRIDPMWVVISCILLFGALLTLLDVIAPQHQQQPRSMPADRPQ